MTHQDDARVWQKILRDAAAGANGLTRTYEPKPGDLVCFDWDGDGVFDHVELVETVPGSMGSGSPFTTIGCNTSFDDSGDQSNGGARARRQRNILGGGRTVFVEVRT